MATPTAQWARATRKKKGLRKLGPEEAHGWGMATRKKLGKGAVPGAPKVLKAKPTRATRAKATPVRGRVSLEKRKARSASLKARGGKRAQTSRPSGLAGGRRATRGTLGGRAGGRRVVRRGRVR